MTCSLRRVHWASLQQHCESGWFEPPGDPGCLSHSTLPNSESTETHTDLMQVGLPSWGPVLPLRSSLGPSLGTQAPESDNTSCEPVGRPPLLSGLPFPHPQDAPNPLERFGEGYALLQASLVAQTVKNPPATQETQVCPLGQEDPWRREWQPTLVFLPGESHRQRSLAGYSPRSRRELDTREPLIPSLSTLLSSHGDLLSLPLTPQAASHLTAFVLAFSMAWGSFLHSFFTFYVSA